MLAMPLGMHTAEGWPAFPPAGDLFSVYISNDRKVIRVAGGV